MDISEDYNGVDPLPGDPRQLAELIESTTEPVRKITDAITEASEKARELVARNRILTAARTRNPHSAAQATGVFLRSPITGETQMIYNDGSVRNAWKRNPELSGRQFRKLRKKVNRAVRAKEQAKTTQETV